MLIKHKEMIYYTLPLLKNFKKKQGTKSTALIILKNDTGMQVAFTNYGARIISIIVPDKNGIPTDVVLGFNSINEYFSADEIYHGASIGRYGNRIAFGKFELNGVLYTIEPNNGTNALHGGTNGFHNQIWDRRLDNPNQVTFYRISSDGEEGFPGTLNISVSYLLTNDNALEIHYRATTDKDTIINVTNHAYFNLDGEGKGNVLNHAIEIKADHYIPINDQQIPTGETRKVANTPFDFRLPKVLAENLRKEDLQLTHGGGGFDHTFVLNANLCDGKQAVATASSKKSGIKLEVLTTEPGVQFYTGNALTGKDRGKTGANYYKQHAFCFETQHFPDSPNHSNFPTTFLKANETYKSQTAYKFTVIK